MALVLDHINGVHDDHRLPNLRILCPNCNATLETHCGRKNRRPPRQCAHCGEDFSPGTRTQRFCSRRCSVHHHAAGLRVVPRPPAAELRAVVNALRSRAAGRRYGVSDTTVRKWLRAQPPAMA